MRPLRMSSRLLLCAPAWFCADLLFGGPRGFWPSLHGRHASFVLAVAALAVLLVREGCPVPGARRVAVWTLALFGWSAVWATIVPWWRGIPAAYVWADSDALLMLPAIALAIVALASRAVHVQRLLLAGAAILAGVHAVMWTVGMTWPAAGAALAAPLRAVYDSPSVFVGQLPNGPFRVLWIGSLWCLVGLFWSLTLTQRRWRLAAAALFALALLSTRSRGLWAGALAGAFVALLAAPQLPPRRRAAWLGAAVAALLLMAAGVPFVADRLSPLLPGRPNDVSLDQRSEQTPALIEAWREHPWIGWGFGASARVIRSTDSPFSYEVVPLALLMKLGIVGVAGVSLYWAAVLRRIVGARREAPMPALATLGATVALLVACSTNPYFLNFVGLGIAGVLLVQVAALPCRSAA